MSKAEELLATWPTYDLAHRATAERLRKEGIAALAAAEAESKLLSRALERVFTAGHNDDCLMCALKDTVAKETLVNAGRWKLDGEALSPAAPAEGAEEPPCES